MNITFKQLETFILVSDLGSFRLAADRLSTTQPNVSSRIAALESALSKTLMQRDAGSVRLTADGHELLGHARNVLRSLDEFIEAANGEAAFDGVIRLGVSEMVVHTWLRDFMKMFKERFENVVVELSVDLSTHLEADLADKKIDLAFHSGPFARKASGEISLGEYPLVWLASPSLGLSESNRLTAEQMSKYPIITHARSTRPFEDVNAHFGQWPELKTRLVPSSNLAACLQMTIDGYGIAALLAPMVEQELRAGQLVQLNYNWTPEPLSFAARFDKQTSSSVIQSAADIAHQCAQAYHQQFIKREA